MAEFTIEWTQTGLEAQVGGADPADFANDTMKLMLLEATFDGAVAAFINHATINEIESADTSYPAGGYTLTGVSVVAASGPVVTIEADAIGDTGVTTDDAATFGALYKDTGTPGTSRIYGKMTITGTVQPSNGPLDITPTGGVYLQVGGA